MIPLSRFALALFAFGLFAVSVVQARPEGTTSSTSSTTTTTTPQKRSDFENGVRAIKRESQGGQRNENADRQMRELEAQERRTPPPKRDK
jgi:hypothetical protein